MDDFLNNFEDSDLKKMTQFDKEDLCFLEKNLNQ
jgi:hypothetical protein